MEPDDVRQMIREELATLLKPRKRKVSTYRISWDTDKLQGITDEDMARWQAAYPAVAVPMVLRQIEAWLVENEHRRNELRNFGRFICTWLSKEQRRMDGRK